MKTKRDLRDVPFNLVNGFFMLLLTFVCMYPFWYIFIYSISDPNQAAQGIVLLPKGITLSNYKQVLSLDGILPAVGVSIARTVLGTFVSVMCVTIVGYLFTKPMYGRRFFYRMLVITMYMNGGVIPTYVVYMKYGLTNSFWVYILPLALSAYNVILTKTYMESLPPALEESAKIDGAGPLAILFKIVMPLSKPIIATIAVFDSVMQWNSWTDNYLYNVDEKLNTLQVILYNYLNETIRISQMIEQSSDMAVMQQNPMTPMSIRMTITMIAVIPVLCVYPFMQKYFVKGIMVGAVKG